MGIFTNIFGKQSMTSTQLAEVIFRVLDSEQFRNAHDVLFHEFFEEETIDEEQQKMISKEIILVHLSIGFALFQVAYKQAHPDKNGFLEAFDTFLVGYFAHLCEVFLHGDDNVDNMLELFQTRYETYSPVIFKEDGIDILAKLYRFHLESAFNKEPITWKVSDYFIEKYMIIPDIVRSTSCLGDLSFAFQWANGILADYKLEP